MHYALAKQVIKYEHEFLTNSSTLLLFSAFGCKNDLISDAWRDMVLNLHNDFRRKLAQGTVQGQNGLLPVGKNIKQLYWDCALEADAQEEAVKCSSTAPTIGTYGIAFAEIATKAACNASVVISNTLKTWWKEGAQKQTDQAKVQGNDIFSQMAYSESDSFACTYHPCSNSKMSFLCVYSQDGKGNAGNLYENGADKTQICGSCANTCVVSLCNVAPAALLPIDTMCQNNPNSKTLMTDDLRNQALNMHNYYRRVLASGWAKDAKLIYAKPSQAMPALTAYDCDLEEEIMTHLKDCAGTAANIANKAQNFIAFDDYQSPREAVLEKGGFAYDKCEVLEQWWSPLEKIGNEDNTYTLANQATLGTYINMAHHMATKVGCGVQTCARIGKTLVQCAYEGVPPIPDDDPIYPVGKTCSKCSALNATPKCSPLGGLCIA
ncbi:SCP-like protein [Ancylostoma caninum]|uniref:SCP-like protein n=1 Tax=Ancylostoma caninum TaxID=29170 RepID=A0A368GGX7_ANCCA|nr:SCP-like protein [Ancylostoma caninum]